MSSDITRPTPKSYNPFQDFGNTVPIIGLIITALGLLASRVSGLQGIFHFFGIAAVVVAVLAIGLAITAPLADRYYGDLGGNKWRMSSIVALAASILLAGIAAVGAAGYKPSVPALTVTQTVDTVGKDRPGYGLAGPTTTVVVTATLYKLHPGEPASLEVYDTYSRILARSGFTANQAGMASGSMTVHGIPGTDRIEIVAGQRGGSSPQICTATLVSNQFLKPGRSVAMSCVK
jgi:MFS family permease